MSKNTIESLAARLNAVEAKLATLGGPQSSGVDATSIQELDIRLSIVEKSVDELIAKPAADAAAALVSAPADQPPVPVEEVVALSPAADVPAAAAVVTDVITAQAEAEAPSSPEVAEVVAAAVEAVLTAPADVVTDPEALVKAITAAVSEAPTIEDPKIAEAAAEAVAQIIETATGEAPKAEIVEQITEAIEVCPVEEAVAEIITSDSAPESVVDTIIDNVVADSPSINVPAAAEIVSSVVESVVIAESETNPDVVAAVSAAVAAVVNADPDVVQDPVAITAAITEAVSEVTPPESAAIQVKVTEAVADIIATATNVEEVPSNVQTQIAEAVAADPELDALDARLTAVEEKVGLLGK